MGLNKSLVIIASLCVCVPATAQDFYVSPSGNDRASGLSLQPGQQGPFQTLARAQQAIRDLKKNGQFKEPVTVHIAQGTYQLQKPLEFDLRDSGFPDREILWQGEPGAKVIISAGISINCKKSEAPYWNCPLTNLPATTAYFDSTRLKGDAPKFDLFVNDQKMQLARWPDDAWAHIKLPVDKDTEFSAMETIPAFAGDTKSFQVHIFPGSDWFDEYVGIASINSSSNTIKLANATKFPFASGRQFYIQNIFSELNQPGEWFYDSKAKNIIFIPATDSTPQQINLTSLPNILHLHGSSHINFKNLTIRHSTKAAITAINSHNVALDHLTINNVGGKAVDIVNGNNFLLSNNEIHHTGGGAIYISGGNRETLKSSGNVIHNNHIHHIASTLLTISPGIQVYGVGAKVTHNLIEQGSNTGILIYGNNHLIEKNELHSLCLYSADCGAIYSSADWTNRGNIIRNNYIHDIVGYGMESVDLVKNTVKFSSPIEARGVYIDDGSSGFEVDGNIFENAGYISIHINGGRDNHVHNNYVSTNNFALWVLNREKYLDWTILQTRLNASPYKTAIWKNAYPELAAPMNHEKWPEGNRIERNVFVSSNNKAGTPLFRYDIPVASTKIGNNIIWSNSEDATIRYELLGHQPSKISKWTEWTASGVEQTSLYADPCVTINNKQLVTCATSPLQDINFAEIPKDIGLIQ